MGKDDQVMVAIEGFVSQDGKAFVAGTTRASAEFVKKRHWEHLFAPVEAHFDIEQATKAPGEKRATPEAKTETKVEKK